MTRNSLGLALAVCALAPLSWAEAPELGPVSAVPEYRALQGTVRYEVALGLRIKGRIQKYELRAWIDRQNPARSYFSAVLDMDSVTVDSKLIPDSLAKSALKVTEHPKSTVSSRLIVQTGTPDVYEAELSVCLRGQTYCPKSRIQAVQVGDDIRLLGACVLDLRPGVAGKIDFDVLLRKI